MKSNFQSVLSDIGVKVVGKASFIDDIHNKLYDEKIIRVKYDNKLDLEAHSWRVYTITD